jgi:competence protein ComEA
MPRYFFVAILLLTFPSGTYAAIVNINTASAAQLDTLPGIGPSKAAAIIDYRATHGPFVKTEDIVNVKGIGPTTYANLKEFITVGEVTPPSPVVVQPVIETVSSYTKQPTKPALTSKPIEPTHAKEEVSAPVAASELAATGAALTPLQATIAGAGILESWWTLGFLGTVIVGGAVLMIL